jgi:chemotaxis receptor (MCP) glutamine deamidase CheD
LRYGLDISSKNVKTAQRREKRDVEILCTSLTDTRGSCVFLSVRRDAVAVRRARGGAQVDARRYRSG